MRTKTEVLLIVTAILEAGAGAALLAVPSLTMQLLLGIRLASPEAVVVARVGGAALLAIGISCWLEHNRDRDSASGLIPGLAVYNATVVAVLVYAGTVDRMIGIGTWPVCILHTALLAWCIACLRVPEGAQPTYRTAR